MALPAWPGTLPTEPQLADFALAQSNTPPIRTEMAAGNVRMRPVGTVRVSQLRLSFAMTAAQYTAFRAFVLTDLAQGSSKFTMPVLADVGLVTRTCYLADGTFTARPTGAGWLVSFSLAVEGL